MWKGSRGHRRTACATHTGLPASESSRPTQEKELEAPKGQLLRSCSRPKDKAVASCPRQRGSGRLPSESDRAIKIPAGSGSSCGSGGHFRPAGGEGPPPRARTCAGLTNAC